MTPGPWRDGKPRECIVCGHPTFDLSPNTPYKTPRCADFQPCADRRDARRARPRTEAGRKIKGRLSRPTIRPAAEYGTPAQEATS
jgi:hypothetical protein